MSTRVVIVEDQQWCREHVRRICLEVGMEVVGEAERARPAVALLEAKQPDIALIDLNLQGENGLDVAVSALKRQPSLRVMFVSVHCPGAMLERVARLGVSGFFDKGQAWSIETFAYALREIEDGRRYFSPSFKEAVRQWRSDPANCDKLFTRCEWQVVAQVGLAQSDEEIATALQCSVRTVQAHRLRAMGKLGIETPMKLMQYAIDMGLTEFRHEQKRWIQVCDGAWVLK